MGLRARIRPRQRPPERGDRIAAALLSMCLMPGGGQIFNGQRAKGILIAVTVLGTKGFLLIELAVRLVRYSRIQAALAEGRLPLNTNPADALLGMWGPRLWTMLAVSLSCYLYGILDAYLMAARQYRLHQRSVADGAS